MLTTFRTHTGEKVEGDDLSRALSNVADEWASNARAIRTDDPYADHVSEAIKDDILRGELERSERIRDGIEPMTFSLWQRLNTELTGECVALLP